MEIIYRPRTTIHRLQILVRTNFSTDMIEVHDQIMLACAIYIMIDFLWEFGLNHDIIICILSEGRTISRFPNSRIKSRYTTIGLNHDMIGLNHDERPLSDYITTLRYSKHLHETLTFLGAYRNRR